MSAARTDERTELRRLVDHLVATRKLHGFEARVLHDVLQNERGVKAWDADARKRIADRVALRRPGDLNANADDVEHTLDVISAPRWFADPLAMFVQQVEAAYGERLWFLHANRRAYLRAIFRDCVLGRNPLPAPAADAPMRRTLPPAPVPRARP